MRCVVFRNRLSNPLALSNRRLENGVSTSLDGLPIYHHVLSPGQDVMLREEMMESHIVLKAIADGFLEEVPIASMEGWLRFVDVTEERL